MAPWDSQLLPSMIILSPQKLLSYLLLAVSGTGNAKNLSGFCAASSAYSAYWKIPQVDKRPFGRSLYWDLVFWHNSHIQETPLRPTGKVAESLGRCTEKSCRASGLESPAEEDVAGA